MGFLVDEVPLSRDSNYYLIWKMRMHAYLEAEGIGVWKSVVMGYTPLRKVKTTNQKEEKKINSMDMESILEGLTYIQKKKIWKCNSAKELWLRLEQLYSNKEQEAEIMELLLKHLTDLQNVKI